MIMRISFILALFIALGCTQTVHLKYRWDKNTEPDVSHYDLFRVTAIDSITLWQLPSWPADTNLVIFPNETEHYPNRFAQVAHIYSAIDSIEFEYDQPQYQGYLRAWIAAYDSAGNVSPMAGSINAVYIGDKDPPARPKILKFARD